MGLSEEIRQKLINNFKIEQDEHVQKITEGLLALEKNGSDGNRQSHLETVFREAHSLKGAARAVGMTTIETIGHAMEDVLLQAKEGQLAFSPNLFDLLYQALDAVGLVIERLEAGESSTPPAVLALLTRLETATGQSGAGDSDELQADPAPAETPEPSASSNGSSQGVGLQDETIRVSVSKLDALMAQFSELLGAKIRAEQRLLEMRQMQALINDWQREWTGMRSNYSRLVRRSLPETLTHDRDISALLEFTTTNQDKLRAFNSQSNALYRQLSNDTLRLSLVIDELQEEIKRVRMLPLSTVTATFGRMVRDLSREQEKQIDLVIVGGETELDKRILEQVKDPLIHLLRNSVDHGIEPAAERQALGKAAAGRIELAASQQGNNVVITVSDDGRGLDLAAIRRAAVQRGIYQAGEVDKLTEQETALLIFNSGLSTSKIITDISGRGVGLDVVRQNIEELHGTLGVDFKAGQGTRFSLTLPLTLASSGGLLIRSGNQVFALPLTTVERMIEVKRSEIATVEGQEAISYQGRPVRLAWLEDLLALPASPREGESLTVVIIAVAERRLGLAVDALEGEQEIVMKSLGKQLSKVGGIAGATILGSGQVVLVLHAADLVKLAGRTQSRQVGRLAAQAETETRQQTILVVDDSITTRTLEKNILEAAGYDVRIATNGEEALSMLTSGVIPQLIVSDVNMPQLDGLGLTERIKGDERYQAIPVILVTSLDSPADKARGIEVGADAYIVKGKFDQGNLLETIAQLL